jgi:hypothetical protein
MSKSRPKAKYLLPGSFLAEEQAIELPERSVAAAVAAAPEHAFAFKLYDSPICDFEFDAGRFRVLPIPQNESHTYYIGGTVFTCDELRSLAAEEGDPKKYDILISNVSRGWGDTLVEGRAIRCRTGNWQPFEDTDEVVEPADAVA